MTPSNLPPWAVEFATKTLEEMGNKLGTVDGRSKFEAVKMLAIAMVEVADRSKEDDNCVQDT